MQKKVSAPRVEAPLRSGYSVSDSLQSLEPLKLALLADTPSQENIAQDDESIAERLRALLEELTPGDPLIIDAETVIHMNCRYNGYLLYSEYYFECFITKNGIQLVCPRIVLNWRHGDTRGQEAVENTAFAAKGNRTYNLGTDTDLCMVVFATLPDGTTINGANPKGCGIA